MSDCLSYKVILFNFLINDSMEIIVKFIVYFFFFCIFNILKRILAKYNLYITGVEINNFFLQNHFLIILIKMYW